MKLATHMLTGDKVAMKIMDKNKLGVNKISKLSFKNFSQNVLKGRFAKS